MYKEHQHFELDDLIQSGYFAVLYAVKSYDPGKGFKFLTYIDLPLRSAFAEVAGVRSSKRDAFLDAISLDAPASEEADTPLLDAIGDKTKN